MNVLVVGGAGYIGGAVTDLLSSDKYKVRVYDRLLFEDYYRKPVDFVYGDILDYEKLLPHLEWADTVIWLASLVGDGACALNPQITEKLNDHSVKWLADNYDGRIIFMSTCSVYGAQDKVLDETSPTNPLSVYATTKLSAEKYLENKNAIIFRLGTIFGLGDIFSRIRLDLVVNTLTVKAHSEGKLTVFGGAQYRPLLHVRDVAGAVVQNLDTAHTGIYNLHKKNYKICDLATIVQKDYPEVEVEKVDMKFEDLRNYRVNSDKAVKTFGFNPQLNVEDGVKELKILLDSHRIKDLNNPLYTNQKYLSLFSPY